MRLWLWLSGAGLVVVVAVVAVFALLSRPVPVPADRALPRGIPVAEGPLRVVTFGTSLTARYDWPARLETGLSSCLDRAVEMHKVARPGAGITWAQTAVSQVQEHAPDLVLIEFVINDADLRDGVSLPEARSGHEQVILALQTALPEAQLALMTMSPAQGPRGWVRPWLQDHYLQYRALAETYDLGLIDLYPRWLTLPRSRRGLSEDGLHPDAEVAAEVIVPAVLGYLDPLCSKL